MAQAMVNFRMDEELKKGMEQTCKDMGMSMTAAFTIFATKVTKERRIPFDIVADSSYEAFYSSPESMVALEEAKRLIKDPNAKSFKTTQALIEDLLGGDDEE